MCRSGVSEWAAIRSPAIRCTTIATGSRVRVQLSCCLSAAVAHRRPFFPVLYQ